jgi:outer membrane protein OmpA-like peptidoglycan-associated protein
MLLQEGALSFSDGTWSISGTAEDAPARDAALALLSSSPQNSWKTDINLVAEASPAAIQPEVAEAVVPAEQGGGTERVSCEAPLAEFSARNSIVFRSGAALITPESAPALAELATDLAACPDVPVHVEGHTDADGNEQLNLALSVARAEAVVNALIERGINPARLYALGYGESSPIADNTTPEGKSQNRRIVVKLATEAE